MSRSENPEMPWTTKEAATYMKLSPVTVGLYVRRGVLKATRKGPINLLTKAECDRYLRERRPQGAAGHRRRKS